MHGMYRRGTGRAGMSLGWRSFMAARRKLSASLVVATAACLEPMGPVESPGADLPITATEPAPRDVETRPASNLPPEVAQLRAAIRGLGDYGTPDRGVYIRALHALADALVVLGPPRDLRQRDIHHAARELSGAAVSSLTDAGIVRDALEDARVAIATGEPREGADIAAYEQAAANLRAATERIDRDRSLMEQHAVVACAFEAALAVLETAVDVRTPPLVSQRASTPKK